MFSHVAPGLLPILIDDILNITAKNIERATRAKKDELDGMTFGRLTVIREATKQEKQSKMKGYTYWVCQCECGKQTIARGHNLKRGNTMSCGCTRNPALMGGHNKIEMLGKVFERLTVTRAATAEEMAGQKVKELFWWAKCECGKEIMTRGSNLRSGRTKSCGCVRIANKKG